MDRCLFNGAAHDDCAGFHKNTQLTAVLTLLVRCSSLLRSLLQLFESGATDSFQVVLRAFEESWYLAFYFRFQDQHINAAKWQANAGQWSPIYALLPFRNQLDSYRSFAYSALACFRMGMSGNSSAA
jgi:hypothetical protein